MTENQTSAHLLRTFNVTVGNIFIGGVTPVGKIVGNGEKLLAPAVLHSITFVSVGMLFAHDERTQLCPALFPSCIRKVLTFHQMLLTKYKTKLA